MAKETVRTNVVMTAELHQWYKNQSDKIGVTMSALLTMALFAYREEAEKKGTKQPE